MGTELEEALTAANATALIAKEIDPLLFDLQRRYAPLLVALPSLQIGSNVYNFNTRQTKVPGGFVTDGGARPVGTSTYAQTPVNIKLLQAVGAVTGFSQEVTRAVIGDLQRQEIESAVTGLTWDIETGICWGNEAATANGPWPQFNGLDTQISQFSTGGSIPVNSLDESSSAVAASITLSHLNKLIELVQANAAMPVVGQDWMIVASTAIISSIGALLTQQQRFLGNGQTDVSLAPGLNVPSYRNIPLVPSSFLGSRGVVMPAVTGTPTNSGGSLAAGTYKYYVAPVFARMGEAQPQASEVSATVSGGSSIVTLSFTAPTTGGYQSSAPILYKVYRTAVGGSANSETLLGVVDAVVTTAADGITPVYATSIVDTGAALIPEASGGSVTPVVTPTAYVGTNAGEVPRWAGGEDVYLISRNRDNIVRPYVRNIQPITLAPTVLQPDALPFALVADTALAVRAPEFGARLRNVSAAL
jgi:hypothetical protein